MREPVTPAARPGHASYCEPTVLVGVPFDADILEEEIFGSVAPIITFADEDEAVRMANDTKFGLVSYVYTGDLARGGMRISERLDAGMVSLNRGLVSDPAAPFGGIKQSGIGRERGHEACRTIWSRSTSPRRGKPRGSMIVTSCLMAENAATAGHTVPSIRCA